MKYHTLFILKIRENVAKFVVCCSHVLSFRKCQSPQKFIFKYIVKRRNVCGICDKAFAMANYLHKHKKIHKDDKLYKCYNCGKTFKDGYSLRRHGKLHTGVKPHKCETCGKAFLKEAL